MDPARARRPAAAAARRFLHRRHRPARLHLLDPVGRPEPRRRLRRPDRHRLGVDADARRLHHGGAGRRPRRGGVASLSRAGGGRRHGRDLRRHRRPAGAAAPHLLLRHDDPGLRHHRHPGGARLEGRHRRRRRHAGPGLPLAVRAGLGLLLFLLHPGGAGDLDDGQHRLEPLRPRPGGDPRRRGRGRGLGHRQAQAADHDLPAGRRAGRRGGRPLRLAAVLHHARRLHLRDVGAVLHRHPDRRPRLDPGAGAGHHHPDGAARVRGAAGAMVDLPLRRAPAGDRAAGAGRHRRPARLQEPPAAHPASRDRAADGAFEARARPDATASTASRSRTSRCISAACGRSTGSTSTSTRARCMA